MRSLHVNLLGAAAVALLFCALTPGAAQGQSVSGRVIDATGKAIPGAQVSVAGTGIRATVDAEGRYRLTLSAGGAIALRVTAIGYSPQSKAVTVSAEGATVDFTLAANPVGLDAIIVTATGQLQKAREIPNDVTQVAAGDVEKAPVTSFADLLNARAAGVTVMPSGGTTGGGSRVRIRGSNSVSLSNEPVFFIDGIRVNSGTNGNASNTVGVGGQNPSRINDIQPEDLEAIEAVKGPSAGTLYGTAAANGIVQVRTKQGRPGPTQWTAYVEGGTLYDHTTWPDSWFGFDTTVSPAPSNPTRALRFFCTLPLVSIKQCAQNGGVFTLNPLRDDSPFRMGSRQQYGVSLSGGSEQTTFYLAGHFENELGVFLNNYMNRISLVGNVHNRVRRGLDVAVNTRYSNSDLHLPDNDNNALGYLGSGLLTSAFNRNGWGFLQPTDVRKISTDQTVNRFTGSLSADATPFSWLTARAVIGLDFTNRLDQRTLAPNQVPLNQSSLDGSRAADPVQLFDVTSNFSATARRQLTSAISSNTTIGFQWFREKSIVVLASGRKLAAGTTSLAGIAIPAVSEDQSDARTLGTFIEEQIGLHDRLFVTGALRRDKNSAFGKNFGFISYPKVGASWVVSEEPFFPQAGWLNSLRLRLVYGQSGLQPGVTDALQFFNPVVALVGGTDVPAFSVGNLGNANLKPERTTEAEGGFDADLANDRLHLDVTFYSKSSRDALINRPLAPSLGVTGAQFYNLGQVSNKGVEITFSGQFSRGAAAWDFSLSAFGNRNRLIDLGKDFLGNDIPAINFLPQRHVEGYPLGGYWAQKILSYNDANGDGIITKNEVVLDVDSLSVGCSASQPCPVFSFLGSALPTQGASLNTGISWKDRFRLSATLDYRAGMSLYDLTAEFRCRQSVCQEQADPRTPLGDQAKAVAAVALGDPIGYIFDADFLKLREVSLTYYAPASLARQVGAKTLSVTIAGRNLATWTHYPGFDPEVNQAGQANFTQLEFLTQPPIHYWIARINVSF